MPRVTTESARSGLAALALALGLCSLAVSPALSQFGTIFGGNPPRPPADVPSGPPSGQPIPPQPPQALPPSSNLPQGGRGAGVQSQPLPPPPGAPAAPLDTRPQQSAAPAQQQPASPTPGLPPGQRQPRGTPQTNTAAVQPAEEPAPEPPTPKVANNTAVFSGLDKITGRIISFDVALNETVQFGALQVTPRACYTRPPTELPMTDGFVEVSEVTLQGEVRRIFNGWMFAASPGLHGVEHSIYDVWLTDCKAPQTKVAEEPAPAPQAKPARPAPQRPAPSPRAAQPAPRAPALR